jgi:hypothetical protein
VFKYFAIPKHFRINTRFCCGIYSPLFSSKILIIWFIENY